MTTIWSHILPYGEELLLNKSDFDFLEEGKPISANLVYSILAVKTAEKQKTLVVGPSFLTRIFENPDNIESISEEFLEYKCLESLEGISLVLIPLRISNRWIAVIVNLNPPNSKDSDSRKRVNIHIQDATNGEVEDFSTYLKLLKQFLTCIISKHIDKKIKFKGFYERDANNTVKDYETGYVSIINLLQQSEFGDIKPQYDGRPISEIKTKFNSIITKNFRKYEAGSSGKIAGIRNSHMFNFLKFSSKLEIREIDVRGDAIRVSFMPTQPLEAIYKLISFFDVSPKCIRKFLNTPEKLAVKSFITGTNTGSKVLIYQYPHQKKVQIIISIKKQDTAPKEFVSMNRIVKEIINDRISKGDSMSTAVAGSGISDNALKQFRERAMTIFGYFWSIEEMSCIQLKNVLEKKATEGRSFVRTSSETETDLRNVIQDLDLMVNGINEEERKEQVEVRVKSEPVVNQQNGDEMEDVREDSPQSEKENDTVVVLETSTQNANEEVELLANEERERAANEDANEEVVNEEDVNREDAIQEDANEEVVNEEVVNEEVVNEEV
ncbi:putative: similar to Zinc finger protein 28, partial [Candida maltosa Xu316]